MSQTIVLENKNYIIDLNPEKPTITTPLGEKYAIFKNVDGKLKVINILTGKYVDITNKASKDILANPIVNSLLVTFKAKNLIGSKILDVKTSETIRKTANKTPISTPLEKLTSEQKKTEISFRDQDPLRTKKLSDDNITIQNMQSIAPQMLIEQIIKNSDGQDLIREILKITNMRDIVEDNSIYKTKLEALLASSDYKVKEMDKDHEVQKVVVKKEVDKGLNEKDSEMIETFKIVLRNGDDEKAKKYRKILISRGLDKYVEKAEEEFLSSFGKVSLKSLRGVQKNSKNAKISRNLKSTTKKGSKKIKKLKISGFGKKSVTKKLKKTKGSKKLKKKINKFGKIYGLQDGPVYSGVYPLTNYVPKDLPGDPMNMVPIFPTLSGIKRSWYPNPNRFGAIPKPLQRPVIQKPAQRPGF